MLKKHGYPVKYGYNADAHSKFGLDFSATKKEFREIPLVEDTEHIILRNVANNALVETSTKNYLGLPIYELELQLGDDIGRLSIVDELECNIVENEDGTYDIDLGPDENTVFKVDNQFLSADVVSEAYDLSKDNNGKNLPGRDIIDIDEPDADNDFQMDDLG